MKSIIVKVVAIVAAIVAMATSSYGNAYKGGGGDAKAVQVELIKRNDHVVALHFRKPEKQLIKIKIMNANTKKVVFTGSKRKHHLAVIKYDLSHLPQGKYQIEVVTGSQVFTQNIEL